MSQTLQIGALNDACRAVAENVLWTEAGQSKDVIETFAAKLEEIALEHVDYVVGQDRDPNLVTRAVLYLAQAHAIPPMGTHLGWYKEMLQCLVELAVPNSIHTRESAMFLHDVQDGAALSLNSATDRRG